MTRKASAVALALALCVTAAPALAGNAKTRTETGQYNTVTLDTDAPPEANGRITNGVTFETLPGERFVTVTIADQSGLPARAIVGQDLDGDGLEDVSEEICGATTAPIALKKGAVVMVWTQEGPCADGTNAVATFGTVTATFTRAAMPSGHSHHHHH